MADNNYPLLGDMDSPRATISAETRDMLPWEIGMVVRGPMARGSVAGRAA